MLADCITVSRILFSVPMLLLPPTSALFGALYLLGGFSDVLDGFAARKLHTESERGERLDSAADLCFALVYAVRILPLLSLPSWILGWTAAIAGFKLAGILLRSRKEHGFSVPHSTANKITGLLLFLLPLSVPFGALIHGATFVCAAATIAVIEEIRNQVGMG